MSDERIRKLVAEELAIKGENLFVREVYVKDIREPLDILNWYRNLYYKEGLDTERGLMANTINDLLVALNTRMERIVERLEEARKEIIRLDSGYHYIYKDGVYYMADKAIEIVKGGG